MDTPTRPPISAGQLMFNCCMLILICSGLFMLLVMAGNAIDQVPNWLQARKAAQILNNCAAHNKIDLSPYHIRTAHEQQILDACLEKHLPRAQVHEPPKETKDRCPPGSPSPPGTPSIFCLQPR